MFTMKMFAMAAVAAAAALSAAGAQAAEFVTNGGFEAHSATVTSNTQFGGGFGGQIVNGWTGGGGAFPGNPDHLQFYYFGGTQTSVSATNEFGDPQAYFHPSLSTLSPNGGNFVALDGDGLGSSDFRGVLSQNITGLTIGNTYTLSFNWGAAQLINRTGATTEQLHVTFGSDVFDTAIVPNPSGGFSGWMTVNTNFKATSTSQLLTFLSIGSPAGLPPIAVLDGVSLHSGVPETATWAMMLVGFGGLGAMIRRRRASAAAATA